MNTQRLDSLEENMKISANINNGMLTIIKEENEKIETWSKKIEDFDLRQNIDTGLSVDDDNKYKLFLWNPIKDNVLMVYTKKGNIKATLAPGKGAYLRILDRICEVQEVSLTKKELYLKLNVGILNKQNLEISDSRLIVGARASKAFDLPILTDSLEKMKKGKITHIREFHFPLKDLTHEMEETSSRIEIAIKINGEEVSFPVKIALPQGQEAKYVHVPLTTFYDKNNAIQLKHSGVGNVLFICRPKEEAEKTLAFRFWESRLISGFLYRQGKKAKKKSSVKVSLFYEKFCQKAEEGAYEIFEMARKRNPKGAYFIINKNSPDYPRIKNNPNVVAQYSRKYYKLLFRTNSYISTETPVHLNIIRSNNIYFRRSIAENTFVFLQHGVTYMKCHGRNSPFLVGREMEPDYIVVNSEKEKQAVHKMLGIDNKRILKTGMGIFSKIAYKHITQASKDIAVIMLTWKPYEDNMEDFTKSSYYKYTLGIYEMLKKYLPEDQIYIVIHPKTGALLEDTPMSSRIWRKPISEVLRVAKLLITDYSSVCYNSFYQGGGVVFFQEDLEFYEKENGKLIPKEEEYIGKRAFSFADLEKILEDGCKDQKILLDHFRTPEFERNYQSINEFSDGKNMERLCDKLKELKLI